MVNDNVIFKSSCTMHSRVINVTFVETDITVLHCRAKSGHCLLAAAVILAIKRRLSDHLLFHIICEVYQSHFMHSSVFSVRYFVLVLYVTLVIVKMVAMRAAVLPYYRFSRKRLRRWASLETTLC